MWNNNIIFFVNLKTGIMTGPPYTALFVSRSDLIISKLSNFYPQRYLQSYIIAIIYISIKDQYR